MEWRGGTGMLGSGKLGYGISRHGGLGALRRVLVGSVRVGHGVAVELS